MRVLMVEDRLGKCQRMARIFEQYQIDYWIETTAEGALQKAMETRFDFLITDLKFPGFFNQKGSKTGVLLMLELVRHNIRIPTVIYSTMLLSEADQKALEEVNYAFIHFTTSFQIEKWLLAQKLVMQKSG